MKSYLYATSFPDSLKYVISPYFEHQNFSIVFCDLSHLMWKFFFFFLSVRSLAFLGRVEGPKASTLKPDPLIYDCLFLPA
jgi:hypothetical protein